MRTADPDYVGQIKNGPPTGGFMPYVIEAQTDQPAYWACERSDRTFAADLRAARGQIHQACRGRLGVFGSPLYATCRAATRIWTRSPPLPCALSQKLQSGTS